MIPHRQEYPLRKRICPLLADRRQAEQAELALLPSRSSKPCTRTVGVQRVDFGNNVSRPGQVARDTVKWLTMHDRGARAAQLAQAKKFLLSAPRCCGLVTSRSQLRFVAVVGENDSLTFFFQAVTDRCAPAFGAFFLLVLGLKKKAPKRMVLKIDRRRVVLLSFFSPGTACNSS